MFFSGPECSKVDGGWGFAPEPTEGTFSAPKPIAGLLGKTPGKKRLKGNAEGRGKRGSRWWVGWGTSTQRIICTWFGKVAFGLRGSSNSISACLLQHSSGDIMRLMIDDSFHVDRACGNVTSMSIELLTYFCNGLILVLVDKCHDVHCVSKIVPLSHCPVSISLPNISWQILWKIPSNTVSKYPTIP